MFKKLLVALFLLLFPSICLAQYEIGDNLQVTGKGTFSDTLFANGHFIAKRTPFANVKAWGAKGDGATNDYAAIQQAIDSNTVVFFPPGNYLYNTTLKMKSNTVLMGYGTTYSTTGVTRLLYKGNSYAIWVDTTTSYSSDMRLENLTIEGTDTALGGARWGADKASFGTSRSSIRNVLFRGFGKWNSIGLKLEGVVHSNFTNVFFDEIKGIPLFISNNSNTQPGPLIFDNCVFGSASVPKCSLNVVLYPDSTSIHSVTFRACLFPSPRFKGLYVKAGNGGQRVSNLSIIGNSFELDTTSTALEIEELFGGQIKANNFSGSAYANTKAIRFSRLGTTNGVGIEGNTFVTLSASGDTAVVVDSTGSATTAISYGLQNFVTVANEVRDLAGLLHYTYPRTGTGFPALAPSGEIFYKTTGDTLGVWNGSTWKKIPLQ